jgi:hypothetical protein
VRFLGGALIIAAILGVGIYKGFVDPSYSANPGESRAWTESCAEGDPALDVDEAASEDVPTGSTAVALSSGGNDAGAVAVVAFFESEADATETYEQFLAERELVSRDAIEQAGSLVFVHPAFTPSEAAETYGHCIAEVNDNVWASWFLFDTKSIGHPFALEESG